MSIKISKCPFSSYITIWMTVFSSLTFALDKHECNLPILISQQSIDVWKHWKKRRGEQITYCELLRSGDTRFYHYKVAPVFWLLIRYVCIRGLIRINFTQFEIRVLNKVIFHIVIVDISLQDFNRICGRHLRNFLCKKMKIAKNWVTRSYQNTDDIYRRIHNYSHSLHLKEY